MVTLLVRYSLCKIDDLLDVVKWFLLHLTDHVIAMRPGGYPVAINTVSHDPDTIRYIEDLSGTTGCQL